MCVIRTGLLDPLKRKVIDDIRNTFFLVIAACLYIMFLAATGRNTTIHLREPLIKKKKIRILVAISLMILAVVVFNLGLEGSLQEGMVPTALLVLTISAIAFLVEHKSRV